MPDQDPNAIPEVVSQFEDFLNARAETPDGITVGDFDNLMMVIYFRMRSIFTLEDQHARMHVMMAQGEKLLHTPGAVVDMDGVLTTPVLRENFDMPDEDYQKMLAQATQDVTDDDIELLLGETT